jgi:hypothetical protein
MSKKSAEVKSTEVVLHKDGIEMVNRFTTRPTEGMIETVIEEIEALLVTRTKEAREYTMKVFWETGQKMREFEKRFKVSITQLVERVAADNRISGRQMGVRNLWFALKFYEAYPVFEAVYETEYGENVSISKIKKLLVAPKPKKERTVLEMALAIIETLGAVKAIELADAIKREVKAQAKRKQVV